MEDVLLFASFLAPVVTGLVELAKRTISIRKKYIPLFSFFTGIAAGLLGYPFAEMPVEMRIWSGAIAGLAGTGLYEIGKAGRNGGKNKQKSSQLKG
ncbi:holin [Fictibacillus aquaticus]|uniref:Holin n=1 Tax=Fictibacillus aquaticus TaxID=2021314 RepID=A0A235FAI2_9BACL|nr:holin [Fictibacillus aquaticus]OYD58292.1 holin [Fictibacillus aquaticus]